MSVSLCICVCVFLHVYECMGVCLYSVYMCVPLCMYVYVCLYVYVQKRQCVCNAGVYHMFISVYLCMYMAVYTCMCVCVYVCVLVAQSCWLFVTSWTVAHQTPLSVDFSRQEYWSGLLFPSPGDLPDLGIEPGFPALQADSLLFEPPRKPHMCLNVLVIV